MLSIGVPALSRPPRVGRNPVRPCKGGAERIAGGKPRALLGGRVEDGSEQWFSRLPQYLGDFVRSAYESAGHQEAVMRGVAVAGGGELQKPQTKSSKAAPLMQTSSSDFESEIEERS